MFLPLRVGGRGGCDLTPSPVLVEGVEDVWALDVTGAVVLGLSPATDNQW